MLCGLCGKCVIANQNERILCGIVRNRMRACSSQMFPSTFFSLGSSTGFMKVITRCELCNGEIEIEESQDGQEVSCPWCAANTTLRLPPKPTRDAIEKVGTWARLVDVRRNTCYKALRIVVSICFGLVYIILAVSLMGSLLAVAGFGAVGMDRADGGLSVAALCIVAVVVVAGHQATLLLIDIADVLIYDSAKRR